MHICEVEVYSARRACQMQAVGITSELTIPSRSLSATSSRSGFEPDKGRLHGGGAWSPSNNNNPNDYLQIDLQYDFFICAVATQGNPASTFWTTKYKLLFSVNGIDWLTYKENGREKIFNGNSGREDVVKHSLVSFTRARFVRFQPLEGAESGNLRCSCTRRSKSISKQFQSLTSYLYKCVRLLAIAICRIHTRNNAAVQN
ncbi:PREDICTED: contactin-associated protein like 5-4-like [Acropora digitifera]|uniref:contactin-associated protein like 5-4-like n=1 Tax=Acropora digitifera TaxID=70779 RepID=UPI00077AB7CF|nr:PREDICTED: contactin-associated protein like 5-4-like [Acropora digitifera]